MRKLIALVGLAVLGVGGFYVVQRYSKEIPRTLHERALAALNQANIVVAGVADPVEMDGRRVILRGAVSTAAQQRAARERIAAIPGVREVDIRALKVQAADRGPDDTEAGAAAKLVDLTAQWGEGRLSLRGHIAGRALRERIAQKIKTAFPGAPTDQPLKVGEGVAPERLVKLVAVGLQALSQTSSGTLRVDDLSLKLTGTAKDEQTRRALTEYLKGQVSSPVVLGVSISVTPPTIAPISKDTRDAPDATVAAIEADAIGGGDVATTRTDSAQPLEDTALAQPDTVSAQPDTVGGAADTVIASVDTARGQSDTAVAGAAPDTAAPEAEADVTPKADGASAAADELVALDPSILAVAKGDPPEGVDLAATSPLTMEQCQATMMWLIAGEKRIVFNRYNRLTKEDDAKVQIVASLLKRCVDSRVIVEAYMDSYGEPDALRAKTRRRAFNVKMRLVALGIDAKRIKIAGFGYNRPRYPNTAKKRHLNRRIEFKLKGVK